MYGLFVPSDGDESRLLPFGKLSSKEELAKSLKTINSYMHGFEKYSSRYNDEYGKRIFESLLCIFTSPFVFDTKTLLK